MPDTKRLDVEVIRAKVDAGLTMTAIAAELGCHRSRIARLLKPKTEAPSDQNGNGHAANGHAEALLAAIEQWADERYRSFDALRKVRAVSNS